MFTLRRHGRPIKEHRDDPVKSAEGWGVVLRDKRLVQIVIAMLVLMIGGYGSLDAGFSLFVVNDLKLSVHSIGVMFSLTPRQSCSPSYGCSTASTARAELG